MFDITELCSALLAVIAFFFKPNDAFVKQCRAELVQRGHLIVTQDGIDEWALPEDQVDILYGRFVDTDDGQPLEDSFFFHVMDEFNPWPVRYREGLPLRKEVELQVEDTSEKGDPEATPDSTK